MPQQPNVKWIAWHMMLVTCSNMQPQINIPLQSYTKYVIDEIDDEKTT